MADGSSTSNVATINQQLTFQLNDLKQEVNTLRNKVIDLEKENSKLSSEIREIKSKQSDFVTLSSMSEMRAELNAKDQIGLLNDLDISGVPETEGESTTHIVMAIATKLKMSLQPQDVVFAHRVGDRRRAVTLDGERPYRPRPICVRFVRRALRDDMLKQARLHRGSTSADLGLPDHLPHILYINERLTKSNRQIMDLALVGGRNHRWKYIWSKDGRIYARQNESSAVFSLRSIEDVNRVIQGVSDDRETWDSQ